jgi:hypothetical protein
MKNDGLSPKNKVFFGYIKIISISYLGPTPIHIHRLVCLSEGTQEVQVTDLRWDQLSYP